MKKALTILVLLLAGKLFASCDCAPLDSLSEKSISGYTFIFYGHVVAISGCDDGHSLVKFSIDELYRGKSFPSTELEFDCASDCQMSFAPDETWIIYAQYTSYGKAGVSICSPSRKLPAKGEIDYASPSHHMDFNTEKKWLETKLGIQKFNEVEIVDQQHHENLKPQGMQAFWLAFIGFAILGVFYFVVRKFIR